MKIKHLILVSLLLAILTIGAVSASDDIADNLTAADGGADIEEAPVDEATPADDVVGSVFQEGDFYVDVCDDGDVPLDYDSVINIYLGDNEPEGNFTISVSHEENSYDVNHTITDEERNYKWVELFLNDLSINEAGTYLLSAKFIPVNGSALTLFENVRLTVTDIEVLDHDGDCVYVEVPEDCNGTLRVNLYDDGTELFSADLDQLYHLYEAYGYKWYSVDYNDLNISESVGQRIVIAVFDKDDYLLDSIIVKVCRNKYGLYIQEFPVIEFNEEFHIYDESFVIVEIPVENSTGRIVVYVDEDKCFNKTFDEINRTHPELGEDIWAYAIGFKDLNITITPGYRYSIEVMVYFTGDEPVESDYVLDEYIYGREEVDYQVDFPNVYEIFADEAEDYYFAFWAFDKDATGRVLIYVNDNVVYNQTLVPYAEHTGGNWIYLSDVNFTYGDNDIKIIYTGDDKYQPVEKYSVLYYYFMDLWMTGDYPFYKNYDYMGIELAKDATGTFVIYVDGEFYKNYTAKKIRKDGCIYFENLELGPHNYTVTYCNDDKYVLDDDFEGEFNMEIYFDVSYYGNVYIDSTVDFTISYPGDADGVLLVTYNGKTINRTLKPVDDGYGFFYLPLSDFIIGENKITFTLIDSKYPEISINKTVYAHARLDLPATIRYNNEEDAISITLPSDASGTLRVFQVTDNGQSEKLLGTATVKDGKASLLLNQLSIGDLTLRVTYVGDYADQVQKPSSMIGDEINVTVVPGLRFDRIIYGGVENTISVEVPEDFNKNVEVYLFSWGGNVATLYNNMANGIINITLPKLDEGSYYYFRVNYYGAHHDYQSSRMTVRGNAPALNLTVTFPSEITPDDNEVYVANLPYDANGRCDLYIDGELYREDIFNEEDYFCLDYYEYGNHTWEIRFHSDRYYEDANASGEFFMDWIDIPTTLWSDDDIEVELEGMEGYVELRIDGELYGIEILDDGEASFPLDGLAIKNHTYEISYYDLSNTKRFSKSGSFYLDYYFDTSIDEDEEYLLTNEFELYIDLPEDATGTVTVNVNGKTYTEPVVDGSACVIIDNMGLYENDVNIIYNGDSKYPERELNQTIYFARYCFNIAYVGGDDELSEYMSIFLPEDANGSVSLYSSYWVERDGGHYEIDQLLCSKEVVNGFANITDDDFYFSIYDYIARYVSQSGEVKEAEIHFVRVPEINITENIVMGENANISILIPGATGILNIYRLVDYDGDEDFELFKEVPSVNGKFEAVLMNLPLGKNEFYLEYEGDDMENMFDEFTPYIIYVSVKNVTIPKEFNSNGIGIVTLELPEGASGKVSVYLRDYDLGIGEDVPLIENATYTSANRTIEITGLTSGRSHAIIMVYVDDKYGQVVFGGTVYVPNPSADDAVNVPDTIESNTYHIFVENATGPVLAIIDNETSQIVNFVDGDAIIDFSQVPAGPHDITLKYSGNSNYEGFVKSGRIMLARTTSDPNLIISIPNVIEGKPITVNVFADDGFMGNVIVKIGNYNVTVSVKEGRGVNATNIVLPVGNYKATLNFTGNAAYYPATAETTFDVAEEGPKLDPELNISVADITEGEAAVIVITTDSTFSGNVDVKIGDDLTKVYVIKGKGNATVKGLSVGTYTAVATFAKNDFFKQSVINTTFAVKAKQVNPTPSGNDNVPAKIVAKDLEAFYNNVKYSVTVYGTNGKVAGGVEVIFKVNGKKVGAAKTNDKGIATIVLKQTPNAYKITSEALGASETKNLKVKQVLTLKKAKVKKSAKKLVLTATLKEGKKAIKGKRIIFKFNGKKIGTVKTDKKGVAKITVKKKFLKKLKKGKKVKYQATYLKDTVKKSVKVQ